MNHYTKHTVRILIPVILVMGFLAKGSNSVFPLMIQHIIDMLVKKQDGIGKYLLLFAALCVVIVLTDAVNGYLTTVFSNTLIQNYRVRILNALYSMKTEEFYQKSIAEYVSILNNNIEMVVENYHVTLLTIFKCTVTLAISVFSLIYLDVRLMAAVILTSLMPLIVPLLFGKIMDKGNLALSSSLKGLNNKFSDFLNGFLFAKINLFQDKMIERTVKAGEAVNQAKVHISLIQGCSSLCTGFLGWGGYLFIIAYGCYLIGQDRISIGALVAAIQIADNIAAPMTAYSFLLNQVKSMKGMKAELDQFSEKEEDVSVFHLNEPIHSIHLENVSLTIDNISILNQINLHFEKGKKYLIAGPSGCGKSSILKLIAGIYEPTAGEVKINELERKKISDHSFFTDVAMINQDDFLLDDTLEMNFFLTENADEVQKEQVKHLLNMNRLLENVSWDSNCVNGGYGFSGGERQRISLVRMMVKEKEVMLLDEPTSALDPQSQKLFEEWIGSQKDKIIIVISHRLQKELLLGYDRIIYMESGGIVLNETPEKILKEKGFSDFINDSSGN